MASTVNVPVIGPTNKGTVVGVSIGGFAVAAYLIYRHQKTASAANAAQAQVSAASGYGYGAGAYGYGSSAGSFYGYGEPGIGYGYGASGGFPAGYYGYGTPLPGQMAATTNAQWTQAAIAQLTDEGYNPETVSAALGAYELGQPVPASWVNIIQGAIGIEGDPPQSGPGGFPPAIRHQGTTGGGGGGGQKDVSGTMPNVTGEAYSTAVGHLHSDGFKRIKRTGSGQVVSSQSPGAGAHVDPDTQQVTLRTRAGK
jgi:hypothetical protein